MSRKMTGQPMSNISVLLQKWSQNSPGLLCGFKEVFEGRVTLPLVWHARAFSRLGRNHRRFATGCWFLNGR